MGVSHKIYECEGLTLELDISRDFDPDSPLIELEIAKWYGKAGMCAGFHGLSLVDVERIIYRLIEVLAPEIKPEVRKNFLEKAKQIMDAAKIPS